MGWKNIKEHFKIKHIVRAYDGGVNIGSAYCPALIRIDAQGAIEKSYEGGFAANEDLARYQREIAANPELVRTLLQATDSFSVSIPVYTYKGSQIIEQQCEELGWPNCTHDGELMYENTHSADRSQVIKWAKKDARAGIEGYDRIVRQHQKEMQEARAARQASRIALRVLEGGPPTPAVYGASRASIPARGAMWRALRDQGAHLVSSWIDEDGEGQTDSLEELWVRIESEVEQADRLVLYVEPEDFPLKGAYIEVGMALSRGIPVYVVAPRVNLEQRSLRPLGSWAAHPLVSFTSDVRSAVMDLEPGTSDSTLGQ